MQPRVWIWIADSSKGQMQQAVDRRQVVLHPVVHVLRQQLVLLIGLMQVGARGGQTFGRRPKGLDGEGQKETDQHIERKGQGILQT